MCTKVQVPTSRRAGDLAIGFQGASKRKSGFAPTRRSSLGLKHPGLGFGRENLDW